LLRVRVPGGEPVLQFDVPELVDRTCLAEDASPVGIGEEVFK
jgi:molybdenum cofactor biosynthesis enzyme MoaA